ncbi:MAG: AarF/ABC1/UbiB kinase family protein [Pseudomonadota bacterium]
MKSGDRGFKVPSGRAGRFLRLGGLGAKVAGSAALRGVREVAAGQRPKLQDLVLTPSNAARVADELSRLRGAAMKLGQLISMDAGDYVPPELSQLFSKLRESAHAMPPHQLKTVLRQNWGRNWLSKIQTFEVRPIASASIGQVHRVKTKDGRALAVKVQYPGVRESIDSDVKNAALLLKSSQLLPEGVDIDPLLEEAKNQLHREADYEQEADHLRTFRHLLEDAGHFIVPGVEDELTTPRILAMDYIEGQSLESIEEAPAETRDRVASQLMDLLLRELFEFRLVQTDPNFANYRYQEATQRIVLLDFGATRSLTQALSSGYYRLLIAALDDDWPQLREILRGIGLIGEDLEPEHEKLLQQLYALTVEPMRGASAYDFGESDLSKRITETGVALRQSGFKHLPAPETIFIHRKIIGAYLLAAKLRARVNVADLFSAYSA